MNKRFLAISCLSAGLSFGGVASTQAATTAPMEIMATVVSACVVDVLPIDFGNYNGVQINTTGEVHVSCNEGVPYAIALDAGLNSDGANRLMANEQGNLLPYRLTYNGADWGDTGVTDTYPGDPVAGLGAGTPESFTVEAMLFPNQNASPGVYTDTVTVTVAF
jgi:spore coat protein U-like protein